MIRELTLSEVEDVSGGVPGAANVAGGIVGAAMGMAAYAIGQTAAFAAGGSSVSGCGFLGAAAGGAVAGAGFWSGPSTVAGTAIGGAVGGYCSA